MRKLFFVLCTVLSLQSFAADNDKLIVTEKLMNIYKGGYWLAYNFTQQPVSTNNLRIELTGNYCGPTYIGGAVYVNDANQTIWSNATKNSKGTWDIKGNSLYRLRVFMEQPKFKIADCTISIYASNLVGGPNDETFVGVLDYQGGYQPNLAIPIYPAKKIKSFRVAIPEFCAGVDVLEAGVMMENVYEKGIVLDKSVNSFTVNGGHGLIISSIAMKLNGPAPHCTIPIFVKE